MQKTIWYIVSIFGAFLILNIFYIIFSNGADKTGAAIGVVIGVILAIVGTKKINEIDSKHSKAKKSRH